MQMQLLNQEEFALGRLYFVREEFFDRFCSNSSLSIPIKSGYTRSGEHPGRPHICINIPDPERPLETLLWLIPISSRIEKYEKEAARQRLKYGTCDKIQIVDLQGNKRAALIQNMIPCTPNYICGTYLDKHTGIPIEVNDEDFRRIMTSARKLILLHKNAPQCGFLFNDVKGISKALFQDLKTGANIHEMAMGR